MDATVLDPADSALDSPPHNHNHNNHNHFILYPRQSPNRLPSYDCHLSSEAGEPPGYEMDREPSNGYRRGYGGRGRHSSNPRSGRGQRQSNPRQHNHGRPIINLSDSQQGQQFNPATNGQAGQGYSSRRSNGRSGRYQQRQPPLASPSTTNAFGDASGRPRMSDRALTRSREQSLAQMQPLKVKVFGIPPGCWTKDIYEALSQDGSTIIRIEMQPGARDQAAWVVFQPHPPAVFWTRSFYIGSANLRLDVQRSRASTVPSPVNPAKLYKEFTILPANAIDFGVRVADTSMMIMHTTKALNKIQVTLSLKRKEIDIKFPLKIDHDKRMCRFRLPLSLLEHIYKVTDESTGKHTLIIPFNSPPQFFMRVKDDEVANTCNSSDKFWYEWNAWYRQTDVVDSETEHRIRSEPLMNHKDSAIIDIGRWTTYRLSFDASTLIGPIFEEFSNALADHGISIKNQAEYTFVEKNPGQLWSLLQEEISITHPHLVPSSYESAFDELSTGQTHLDFAIRYQLEACLSNGFLKEQNITRTFLERLASMKPAEAVYILEKTADKQVVHYDPMEIFNTRVKGELAKKVPSYCVLSRSANITPTMIHVASPVVETSNRIIRKYATDADRFIRVKFSDEKTEGPLSGVLRSEAVFERIRRAMTEGIVVGGRYYEFLAFGNSQFREHGAYFYAPTSSVTADQIRLSMGTFNHIKTVAKFGARLGQCFSTTRYINVIVKIEKIADIERNGFLFTDGVGKLSRFLAQMAARELGLQNPFDDPPSLYQFRLAGCKGVLAIDPKLMGTTIHIRPSQYKFEAPVQGLEIIRASAFATACFNRQLIIVLSTLGVADHIFIRKQQEMVNYLERATQEESIALERLQRNIDFNQTTLTMAAMILDGFMKSREPFMMSLLQLWRAYHMKYLKEKARIAIEQGAFVLGCIDETAILRGHYDDPQSRPDATRDEKLAALPEIFLQISDPDKKGHYKVIEGICILARNPSLHAGDLRIVRAVDVSALHHMKNVVVLPQNGDRDIANMCSGGDLDGDDYLVMWDKDFLPETINEPPMDFTPEKPNELSRPITVKDMTDFFVTYIKNDSLGRIAVAHLAQADYNAEGVRDEKCLELARLHSQAVDYPKSGIPAIMDRELKPKKWPHFMDNKHRTENQIYQSKTILGMLYDQVKLVDFKPRYENAFDSRILDAFELDEAMLKKATEMKESYDFSLKRLMAKHAISTEFEAWSVFVLSHNQESRDYTFAEEFGRTIGVLKAGARQSCREAAGAAGSGSTDFAHIAPFVAAMYTVTAREMKKALEECRMTKTVGGQEVPLRKMDPDHMPLMSFPWLFVNELGQIASRDGRQQPIIQPSPPQKNTKKHANLALMVEPGMGDVETEAGVTHYGEVLKLDFGQSLEGIEQTEDENGECEMEDVKIEQTDSALDRLARLW